VPTIRRRLDVLEQRERHNGKLVVLKGGDDCTTEDAQRALLAAGVPDDDTRLVVWLRSIATPNKPVSIISAVDLGQP
jgi:hypothetical protein